MNNQTRLTKFIVNKLHRFIFIVLAVSVFISLAACGSGDDDDDASDEVDFVEAVWEDSETGLMWQNGYGCGDYSTETNPYCRLQQWFHAISYCQDLQYNDYDDWRLPTIDELRGLIRGCDATAAGGACKLNESCLDYEECLNDVCEGCAKFQGPGSEGRYWPATLKGEGSWYWSSSAMAEDPVFAYGVGFGSGRVYLPYNINFGGVYVRCVRDASKDM